MDIFAQLLCGMALGAAVVAFVYLIVTDGVEGTDQP